MTSTTIATPAASPAHHNNFGVLRLVFASMVLLSHSYPLVLGSNSREPLALLTHHAAGGAIAVDCFFLMSGYLVTQSWQRSRSGTDYLRKRLLRIYPGYLIAVLFSIVVAGLFANGGMLAYLKEMVYQKDGFFQLLLVNGGAINNDLAFASNPYPHTANGSLWTLLPELRCYIILMAIGSVGWLRDRRAVVSLLCIAFPIYALLWVRFGGVESSMARLCTWFLLGTLVALSPAKWLHLTLPRMLGAVAALGLGCIGIPALQLLSPFAAAWLVLAIAVDQHAIAPTFFAKHDFSYGIYLYAFVVQQAIVAALHPNSPWTLSLIALPVTIALGAMSWHWVESPALRLKTRD